MPKFFSRRGLSPTLSWKWRRATLSPSFGLFRSEEPLFRGVPGGSRWVSLVRICPRDHFPCRKKKIYLATHSLAGRVNFVISFVEIFALICTQTAWKRMYIAPPTPPPSPTPPTRHPPVRMIMLYQINDSLSFILCDFVTLNTIFLLKWFLHCKSQINTDKINTSAPSPSGG